MSKKRKLNKFKIIILVVILTIFFMTISGYGRFIYNSITDRYLTSKKFYFSSNLLTANRDEYTFENWDGEGIYQVDVEICSQNNDLEQFDEDLYYNLLIEYNDSDIACSLDYNEFKESTGGYTLDLYENIKIPVETHNNKFEIYVKAATDPETGETKELNFGENYQIKVTAYTTEPYKKTISATLNLKINQVSYNIKDGINWPYVVLTVRNSFHLPIDLKIEFDETVVRLDMNDNVYLKNADRVEVDEKGVVTAITFRMPKETSQKIKFYKTSDDNPMITTGDYDLSKIFKITKTIIVENAE